MPKDLHQWLPLVLTFLAAVAVNAVVLAFTFGQVMQRVTTLEEHREEQRAEWRAARERAEKIIERLEQAIRTK